MPTPRREKPRVRRRRDAAVTAGLPQAGLGPIPPCLEALGTPWRLSPCPPEGSKAVSGHRPTLPFSNEETCPQDPWGLAPGGAYKLLLCVPAAKAWVWPAQPGARARDKDSPRERRRALGRAERLSFATFCLTIENKVTQPARKPEDKGGIPPRGCVCVCVCTSAPM